MDTTHTYFLMLNCCIVTNFQITIMRSTTLFFVVAISVSAVSSLETCWVCDSAVSGQNDCDTPASLNIHPSWTTVCDKGCAKAKFTDNGQLLRGCFVGTETGRQLCSNSEGYCADDNNTGRSFCIYCCPGKKCNSAGTTTMSLAVGMATFLSVFVLKA